MEVAGIRLYSCYLPHSATIDEFLKFLDDIASSTRSSQLPVVIGDFNEWAEKWVSVRTNHRGRALLEAFATLELEIINMGTRQTYAKWDKSSVVDPRLIGDRLDWTVSDIYTDTDHFAIVYHIQYNARRVKNHRSRR